MIAGVMRLGEDDRWAVQAIDALAVHCDALYFWANHAPGSILAHVHNYPKTRDVRADAGDYGQGHGFQNAATLTAALAMVESDKPDWVLFPDTDELLPPQTWDVLRRADHGGAAQIEFPFVYPWGDPEQIAVGEQVWRTGPHVKAARWREGLTTLGWMGFCALACYENEPRYQSPWPLRHLSWIDAQQREWRRAHGRPLDDWTEGGDVLTVPWRLEWTWNQYTEIR